tara:strand:+ start:332 stop:646 length:315 start_codon:yes stop_codon:yes gene_type:complete
MKEIMYLSDKYITIDIDTNVSSINLPKINHSDIIFMKYRDKSKDKRVALFLKLINDSNNKYNINIVLNLINMLKKFNKKQRKLCGFTGDIFSINDTKIIFDKLF